MALSNLMEIMKSLRSRYPALTKRLQEVEALGRWEAAVGPAIHRHSRAVRVQDSVLWVEVDHPIWKTELHHRKQQILEILNRSQESGSRGDSPPIKDLFFIDAKSGANR